MWREAVKSDFLSLLLIGFRPLPIIATSNAATTLGYVFFRQSKFSDQDVSYSAP